MGGRLELRRRFSVGDVSVESNDVHSPTYVCILIVDLQGSFRTNGVQACLRNLEYVKVIRPLSFSDQTPDMKLIGLNTSSW